MAGNLDFLLNLRANTRGLDDIRNGTSQLVQSFYDATRALAQVGDASELSAESIEQMAQHGQRMLDQMNGELRVAQLELNRLSATNATPQDIEKARERVSALERGIQQASSAIDTYRDAARAATETSPIPSEFERDVSSLVDELDSARRSIDANGNSATHTRRQLEEMTRRASAQIDQYENDLRDARLELNRLSATNATPQDIENARARVRELERGLDQSRTALDGLNDSFRETEPAARRSFDGVNKSINGARFAVTALVGAMAAVGVGLGVNELAQAADSYTNLSARINIATREGGDFTSAMAGVHQVALATNSSLDATGSLFVRLNTVGKDMGMTQQQALDLTKTVTQAIQVGGGSAQASEAAVTQFIQAMQGGVLRGEEFNSIMENGFGLAESLAKGLGVTTGELRKMAENGELSAERVIKAVQSQADEVQSTYNQFPTTIGNALQKIATSWQILIGEMDQANGASATAAKWLSMLADNMSMLKPIIADISNGFTRLGEYYSKIYDQATIDSLKTALTTVYETMKTLFKTVLEVGEGFYDLFSNALSSVLGFSNGLYPAGEQVNGFKKFIDLLNIALSFLNDGFSTIGIGVNLFTGTLYGLSAAWYEFKSILSWGDVKTEALANMEAMRAKSQEYFDKGFDGVKNFESETLKSIDNIKKTEVQKNADRIAENQKTLDQLKAQEEKHKTDYRAISEERIKLNQQLVDARKASDQSAIDAAVAGLTELDAKEKEYHAESQKITDAKIQAAQIVANETIKSADAAGIAQLKVLNVKLAAQGLQAEFDSTGKIIVRAMDDGARATEIQVNATDKARKAAIALGMDLDVSLGRVSAKFKESEGNLNSFIGGLEGLGVTGEKAGEVTYQAWLKWLQTAKSQAEIDYAKQKLQEFGLDGQIATSQVEQGLIAIKLQAQELPDDIDPVTEAFKRLGIETKENLKLAAQQALMDYIKIRDSGKATAEGVQSAYQKAAQAAAISGDAGVISATNAANAGRNLEIQIDSTGKASVKAMDELKDSNDRVRNSAEKIGDGYRNAGHVAREEAKSTEDAWLDAVNAASQKFDAEMKRQGKALSEGIYNYNSYSRADVISQLKSKGFDDKEAERQAGIIWSKAMEADRDAKLEGLGKGGNPALKLLIEQEFNSAAAKGLTTQHGTNRINELLKQTVGKSATSTSTKAPKVDVNSLAPNVSTPAPSAPTSTTSKSVAYTINIGGQEVTLYGNESDQDPLDKMMRELEAIKRSS